MGSEGEYTDFTLRSADKRQRESVIRFVGCDPLLTAPVTLEKDGEVDLDEGLTEAEAQKKAEARRRVPWLLKDAEGVYEGNYELGQRSNYAVVVMQENEMMAMEVEAWYNFKPRVKVRVEISAEEAEETMRNRKKTDDRLLSRHLKKEEDDGEEGAGPVKGVKARVALQSEQGGEDGDGTAQLDEDQAKEYAKLATEDKDGVAIKKERHADSGMPRLKRETKLGGDSESSDGLIKVELGDDADDEDMAAFSDDDGDQGTFDLNADDNVSEASVVSKGSARADEESSSESAAGGDEGDQQLDKSGKEMRKILNKRASRVYEASDDESSADEDFGEFDTIVINSNPDTAASDGRTSPASAVSVDVKGKKEDARSEASDVDVSTKPAVSTTPSRKRPVNKRIKKEPIHSSSYSEMHETASDPTALNLGAATTTKAKTKKRRAAAAAPPPAKKARKTAPKTAKAKGKGAATKKPDSGAAGGDKAGGGGSISEEEVIRVLSGNSNHTLRTLTTLFKSRLRTDADKHAWKVLLKKLVVVKKGGPVQLREGVQK